MTGFSMLLPEPALPAVGGRWATVTQASPLRVKLDGETTALAVTPDTLVAGLVADDRVWVQVYRRRLVVLGKAVTNTGWASYTPVLSATTTDPTLGTGAAQQGVYYQDPVTGMVDAWARIVYGTSGTDPGSGTYLVSLPTAIDHSIGGVLTTASSMALGSGAVRDNSATVSGSRQVVAQVGSTAGGTGGVGQVFLGVYDGTNSVVTHSGPFAWAASDVITLTLRYPGVLA